MASVDDPINTRVPVAIEGVFGGGEWSADSREIFYINTDGWMVSVEIQVGDRLGIKRMPLFNTGLLDPGGSGFSELSYFTVDPLGRGFIMVKESTVQPPPAKVVLNFVEELRAKVGN